MKTFKQFLLEIKLVNIPYDGRTAPTRYNNPGGAYPSSSFEKFGMKGYGIIGGGHKIGYYDNVADGVAANIYHLRKMPIVGKTVAEARNYWVTGRMGGRKSLPGMNDNQVITAELLKDHNWLAAWMVATAKEEGFKGTLDRNVFDAAFKKLDNVSNYDPSKAPELQGTQATGGTPQPGTENTPGGEANNAPTYETPAAAVAGLLGGLDKLKKAITPSL